MSLQNSLEDLKNEERKRRFSNRLKNERARLKLSIGEIAKQCGVSQRKWKQFENNEEMPDILVLLQLAHLGIDMEYLFTASKRLNDDEIRIIEQYRSATIQSQFAIQGIMEIIEKKTPEEQKADEERYWQMMLYGNLNP